MSVAVIPGDGIGAEVIPAALRVLTLLTRERRLDLDFEVFDWGARRWLSEGVGIPDGGVEMLARQYGAVLFGALGDPRIPDMAHGRAILLGLRRGLGLYVSHRPIELPGVTVDLYRENTQGLYAGVGGTTGGPAGIEVAVDECVYTRPAVERFVRYCLRDLRRKGRRTVTLVHKANAVPHTGALWQDVFRAELAAVPELTGTEEYVDAFCYHLIRDASRYEGVLTENLFGDIASDVGAAMMGGLGVAASASVCPETGFGLFEPVHGSAPDIAGTGTANPYAAMAASAMLLRHLGHDEEATCLRECLRAAAQGGTATRDLGGSATTEAFTATVLDLLERRLRKDD
ncbi:isocitrate/isopropylmalate dehydrogenase family protein [Streptosporangiaceae bacterium NEAU-GS5]|nr:isocitrate/isopropylmalate dehydrogenase family protein [Streptosporangiaceae bacterium NEAU-GS5]